MKIGLAVKSCVYVTIYLQPFLIVGMVKAAKALTYSISLDSTHSHHHIYTKMQNLPSLLHVSRLHWANTDDGNDNNDDNNYMLDNYQYDFVSGLSVCCAYICACVGSLCIHHILSEYW